MSLETWYAIRRAGWLGAGVALGQCLMAILAVGLATVLEALGWIPGPVVGSLREALASRPFCLGGLAALWLATASLGWLAYEGRRNRGLYGPGDLRPARARISTAGRLVLGRRR